MAWPAAVLPCFISRFLYRPLSVAHPLLTLCCLPVLWLFVPLLLMLFASSWLVQSHPLHLVELVALAVSACSICP